MNRCRNIFRFVLLLVTVFPAGYATASECAGKNDFLSAAGCEITASIPYAGGYGMVNVKAYPSTQSGSVFLNNVVVLIKGFDPGNAVSSDVFVWNVYLLTSQLRSRGYDLLVLNYQDRSNDYIQKNAFALAQTLQRVQAIRSTGQPFVVAGYSMGGIVARYALAYMETNGIPHNTRLYISYDAPHRGASVPLAIQRFSPFLDAGFGELKHQISNTKKTISNLSFLIDLFMHIVNIGTLGNAPDAFFSGPMLDQLAAAKVSVTQARQMLALTTSQYTDSPAARQMLANHYGSSGADPLRAQMVAELSALGEYPQKMRKVAVTNGNLDGAVLPNISSDTQYFSYYKSNDYFSLLLEGWATDPQPLFVSTGGLVGYVQSAIINQTAKAFHGRMRGFDGALGYLVNDWKTYNEETYYAKQPAHLPLDNVAGSKLPLLLVLRESFNEAVRQTNVNQYLLDPINIPLNDVTFIPTYSALDLDPSAMYNNLASATTRFDAFYAPPGRIRHDEIDPQVVNNLVREIVARPDLGWLSPVLGTLLQ